MKFGVGVRVEGKSGAFAGVQGVITSRLKVGTQNFLLIRWDNGRDSRETTGAVRNLPVGGPNQVVVRNNQAVRGLQPLNVNRNMSDDEMSQSSSSSEEGSIGDMGDQHG